MKCHGCDGKGWVDSKHKGPCQCPICKGVGQVLRSPNPIKDKVVPANKYDQDAIWTNMREWLPTVWERHFKEEVEKLQAKVKDERTHEIIVHLLFDSNITPQGNLIFHHLQHSTITGPRTPKLSRDEILARGYVPDKEGGVVTYYDVPVGPVFDGLYHWCENHTNIDTFKMDPNRKGNPCFCDEDMLAMIMIPHSIPKLHETLSEMIDFVHTHHEVGTRNIRLYLLS